MKPSTFLIFLFSFLFICCDEESVTTPDESCATADFFEKEASRKFKMGFTTWPYGAELAVVNDTYSFISANADIYVEHIDNRIPWSAWINRTDLPADFVAEMEGKAARRMAGAELMLAVSLLTSDRTDLALDWDGSAIAYSSMDDPVIEEAYFKHLQYLIDLFSPERILMAIELNELYFHSPEKWEQAVSLMNAIKLRLKTALPSLELSVSVTLHNLYQPDIANPSLYQQGVFNFLNQQDFAAISFYPFFKAQNSLNEFQAAFNFLNANTNRPIAFTETSHLAEPLTVAAFNLSLPGDECGQNAYLETLLLNAQQQDYEFVIWWAHRDYDRLWETFPSEVKDLGKLWRDTGLLDEAGNERVGFKTWKKVFQK